MKLFVCTNHAGHYPVGVASVIVASNIIHAQELLDEALAHQRLDQYSVHKFTLVELPLDIPQAYILRNGEY